MFIANLDSDDIYWGVKEIADDALGDLDVEIPADCDLKAGAYKYDRAQNAFLPVPPQEVKEKPGPNYERALYAWVVATHERDASAVPADTLTWASGYERSVDAMGEKLNYFLNLA